MPRARSDTGLAGPPLPGELPVPFRDPAKPARGRSGPPARSQFRSPARGRSSSSSLVTQPTSPRSGATSLGPPRLRPCPRDQNNCSLTIRLANHPGNGSAVTPKDAGLTGLSRRVSVRHSDHGTIRGVLACDFLHSLLSALGQGLQRARAGARLPGSSPSGVTTLTLTDCHLPATVADVYYPSRPCGREKS